MSYFEIYPKNKDAEKQLCINQEALFEMLTECAKEIYEIPEYDIICELNQCTVLSFSKKNIEADAAPDVVIKVSTNDMELQEKADALKNNLIEKWNLLFGKELALECWLIFFHTWGCNIDFSS